MSVSKKTDAILGSLTISKIVRVKYDLTVTFGGGSATIGTLIDHHIHNLINDSVDSDVLPEISEINLVINDDEWDTIKKMYGW